MPPLLVVALVLAAALPSVASESDAVAPARVSIGFREYPAGLHEGGLYDGATIVRTIPAIRAIAVMTLDPLGFAHRHKDDPNVRYVADDAPIPLLLGDLARPHFADPAVVAAYAPNDTQFGSQYGPQQVRADLAWDTTLGGNAAVCIIDTGVRRTHEDIGAARYQGGHDFANNDEDPSDDQGHGTHVAGIAIGLVDNGVGIAGMGNSDYYAVKALDSTGHGSWSDIAASIAWCADNTASRTVISLSLGGLDFDQGVADAVHYAFSTKGKLVVAATGNGYCNNCVSYPAALPEAIAIACTDEQSASCVFASKGPQVDFAAPGDAILSTYGSADNAYSTLSGTSMSTPHASGIFALVWGNEPSLTAADLWQRANDTVEDIGAAGVDNPFGWGRLDALCLLTNTTCTTQFPPMQPIWSQDLDGSLALPFGWSADGLWHVSSCRALSAPHSLAYNRDQCPTDYDVGSTAGNATSPPIAIPTTTAAAVQFKSRHASESPPYDLKTLLVSNGGPYHEVFREIGGQNVWNDVLVDLSAYAGQTITLRFRFDSGDPIANGFEGWYVDDVRVLAATDPVFPPDAPNNPVASAGPGAGAIRLTWTPPAYNGGAAITGYHVYRAASPVGAYSLVGTPLGSSFTDTGLGNGATWSYKVAAANVAGESPMSPVVSATTFTVPSAPRSLDATPGASLLSIDLAWIVPDSTGGAPISAYRVYRDGAFLGLANATRYTDAKIGATDVHHYNVTAVNLVGEGAASDGDCSRPNPWPMRLEGVCELSVGRQSG